MIIYWHLYHFNAVALIQVTEPWNICLEIKNNAEFSVICVMFSLAPLL